MGTRVSSTLKGVRVGMARGSPSGAQSSGGGDGCALNAVLGAILPACSGWWPAGSSVTQRLVGASQWPSAPPTARKTRVTLPGHKDQGRGSFQGLPALTLSQQHWDTL